LKVKLKLADSSDKPIIITNYPVTEELFHDCDLVYMDSNDISNLYTWIKEKKYFGAYIFLDEAGILFPSMDWKAIPKDVIYGLRQHRHSGYTLYYTAQDMDDVSAPLRRITQFVNEIDGWSVLRFSSFKCFSVRKGKANYKDQYDKGVFIHSDKLYGSYSTHHDTTEPDWLVS